eukprot:TRINITY_DN1201_c0_g1_i2.p1 TRINITY_DN1201_c0_g1~~TRINITY_DN1201_c0_g1_i2.p1  ORF type:complete len:423 (+),score=69.35 TRINITY_DN1201_c0_g1_i2:98-1366(+)
MEATTALRSSSGIYGTCYLAVKSDVIAAHQPDFLSVNTKFRFPNGRLKHSPSISIPKQGQRRTFFVTRRNSGVRASSSHSDSGSSFPIAPLRLESPIGQFLSQILANHPHLLPAAVDQQLQQLQTDLDAEKQKEEDTEKQKEEAPSSSGTDLVLYRRIAELKAAERRRVLEEILYALVVQKFVDAEVPLVPTISPSSDPSGRVDSWPGKEEKLEGLHSPEAYQMIKNHLALILGNRLGDSNSIAHISKLRVGQVYAASIMYGYFLKRVDQRFQLEKSIKTLPFALDEEENAIQQSVPNEFRPVGGEDSHPENSSWPSGGFGHGIKHSRLRSYVMSFDPDTLQKYATIRSKEAVGIIEKHTEALFGRPEVVIMSQGTVDSSKDEVIRISFSGLTRLVLEAVTFGSFLWDVESYVDSRYHFVTN